MVVGGWGMGVTRKAHFSQSMTDIALFINVAKAESM